MFNTLFADQTDRAIDAQAERGRSDPPPKPGMMAGTGRALATALPAGALEMGRAAVGLFDMQVGAQERMIAARQGQDIPIEEMFKQSETAKDLGKTIKSLEPDPQTSGTAAQVVHGLGKFIGKTAGYAMATGPATPLALGLDETINEAQRLADQGVDVETRNKAAAVHGAMTAAATAIPVAGRTKLQTAALALVGGPTAFMAEQATINKILDDADYSDIAAQYDPFDITGLLLSTAAPLTFGAAVHLGRARSLSAMREAQDAARVMLDRQREQERSRVDPTDAAAAQEHAEGMRAAEQRINEPKPTDPTIEPQAAPELPQRSTAEAMAANLEAKIKADPVKAEQEYNALPEAEGGKVLNTDVARELSPEYRADRSRAADVHQPASQFIKDLYAEKLKRPTPAGDDPVVLFTAGGTGAGKSTGLNMIPEARSSEIIYDTTMNELGSSVKKIEQALEAGRGVDILYTFREPLDALVNGALPRAERTGRTIPLAEFFKIHKGSYETIFALAEKYAGDERVGFRVIDNSHGKDGARLSDLESLPKVAYDEIEGGLYEALESARQAGAISERVYQGFTRDSQRATRSDRQGVRGQPEQAGPRAGRAGPQGQADQVTGQPPARSPSSGADAAELQTLEADNAARPVDGLDPVVAQAEQVALESPDMQIELDDGTRVSAAEAMAQADAEIQQAQQDAKAFEAAVGCLIRTGG